jgi:6-phosphofructokinase 1
MKTLIVVSGGDAPGINALIGHYVRIASDRGDQVLGARGGFPGLLSGNIVSIALNDILPWMGRAGSFLPTSRDPVLSQSGAGERIQAQLYSHQVDHILLFGGNGTLRHIPPLLRAWGISCIGIPTTIDNDVPGTEISLGFDSACNDAYHAIDGVLATGHALNGRMFMVETLGGTCGRLALAVGHGAGAHAVLVPEYDYDESWLADRLMVALSKAGFALLVLCEGAKGARTLADTLPQRTGVRMRDVRLGHAQRGAAPSHRDRVLAAQMAQIAASSFAGGGANGIILVRDGIPCLHNGELPEANTLPDRVLYNAINGLSE